MCMHMSIVELPPAPPRHTPTPTHPHPQRLAVERVTLCVGETVDVCDRQGEGGGLPGVERKVSFFSSKATWFGVRINHVNASHDATMDGRAHGREKSGRTKGSTKRGDVVLRTGRVHHVHKADVRRRGVYHVLGHDLLAQVCSLQSGCAMQEDDAKDACVEEPLPRQKRSPRHPSTSSSPPNRNDSTVDAAFPTKQVRVPISSCDCLVSPLIHPMANFQLPRKLHPS